MSSTVCSSKLLNLKEVFMFLEDILWALESCWWELQAHPELRVQTPLRSVWAKLLKPILLICVLSEVHDHQIYLFICMVFYRSTPQLVVFLSLYCAFSTKKYVCIKCILFMSILLSVPSAFFLQHISLLSPNFMSF